MINNRQNIRLLAIALSLTAASALAGCSHKAQDQNPAPGPSVVSNQAASSVSTITDEQGRTVKAPPSEYLREQLENPHAPPH